jgi:polysaccharide pyruvyl transferase WcaK-like protein
VAFSLKTTVDGLLPGVLSNLGIKGKYFVAALRRWKYTVAGFEEKAAAFCDHMSETYGLTTVFLPMQPSEDTKISKKIISAMKTEGKLLSGPVSTDEILSLVGGAEFVFSMRLHTIIYAARAATPCIAVVYDPKVKAMMDITTQEYYVNAESVSIEKLNGFGRALMENKEAISARIKEKAAEQAGLAKISVNMALELLNKKEF